MRPAAKRIFIEIVCYLYILLFVYAAVSKLLDFENFEVQIGQSPLLSSFAQPLALSIIAIEFLIVLILLHPAYKLPGLYLATSIMAMFSLYIYWILNHSTFIPCSCGGVLEKMNWDEHLFFNLAFLFAGIAAIILFPSTMAAKRKFFLLVFTLLLSALFMAALIYKASQITHYNNKFIRILSATTARKVGKMDLGLSSYYIAGYDGKDLYLGNNTSQLLLTAINSNLTTKSIIQLKLPDTTLPYRAVSLKVTSSHIYAYDGMVPAVFRSGISGQGMKRLNAGDRFFSLAQPVASNRMVLRTQAAVTGESTMGLLNTSEVSRTSLFPSLLEKQSDGLFDTDGTLLYSKERDKIVYIYAYRNQYVIADARLQAIRRGTTIDTISKPDLAVAHLKSRGEKKLEKAPLVVNRTAAISGNLLFVSSGIPGRYESSAMWKRASIIDVYDFEDQKYLTSFYIDDQDGKRMRNFTVESGQLYALIGSHIVHYRLGTAVTKYYKPSSEGERPIGQ
ncbi:hypothetical protein MH928_13425 [Flavobacterium sp. WW92]|uniref:MauE/DoxX family redox-associated membrane protein n=1 Tax=unclassified Flavobacterium TaxID=196869 RepID=UPI002224FD39|nr:MULTISPECIES: MauE/DoxX family redox-associated membrane protein [unclassified Flavobacterium]WDO12320.1 hypothetical protein MH928_13425 [Flavobacterium sp. WW92]